MAGWFERWFPNRALKSAALQYHRRLGPCLKHDYGAAETYTAAQIKVAVTKCELPAGNISIGYAAFMTEADFGKAGGVGDYGALRKLFNSFNYLAPSSAHAPAAANFYAQPGGR